MLALHPYLPFLPHDKITSGGWLSGYSHYFLAVLLLADLTPFLEVAWDLNKNNRFFSLRNHQKTTGLARQENLARSYNDLLSDMDGLLSKSAELGSKWSSVWIGGPFTT